MINLSRVNPSQLLTVYLLKYWEPIISMQSYVIINRTRKWLLMASFFCILRPSKHASVPRYRVVAVVLKGSPLYSSKTLFFGSANPICRAFYGSIGDRVDRQKGALYYILRQTPCGGLQLQITTVHLHWEPINMRCCRSSRTRYVAVVVAVYYLITFILSRKLAKMLCTVQ